MSEPRVSVVVIFMNASAFLDEAVRSVIGQTYASWELLLVDDGSTDSSSEIARHFAQLEPGRIRYLEHHGHENRGMSASRNLGIYHARGEYISLLDADDALFPEALEEQVEILDSHPAAAMTYGPILWWYSWSGKPEDKGLDYVEELGVPANDLVRPPTLVSRFLRDRAAVPSGLMVRRSAANDIDGFEEEFRGEYEDQVFCFKLCLRAPVFASGRCWYRYRQHPDSAVAVGITTGRTADARVTFLDWAASYLRAQRPRPLSVWWAIRVELWRCRRPPVFRIVSLLEGIIGRLLVTCPVGHL